MDNSSRFIITKADSAASQEINIDVDTANGNLNKDSPLHNGDSHNVNLLASPEIYQHGHDGMLALYADDIPQKGRFQNFLHTVTSYTASIPVADQDTTADKKLKSKEIAKLGTLVGVFLPCIQNIFGVILFIRLSWIVGTAGILQGFAIVLTCCCCTMLTAISMSAIATNGRVPAGGSYFMISRSLGPEFGGAVGVLFYLGTSFASSMYILGAVEILLTYIAPSISLFGDITSSNGEVSSSMLNNMRVYGSILVLLMGGLVFIGVKYVNKFASLFLACVLLSILAIFVGFFTIHTRTSPEVCMVNGNLLKSSSYGSCSKNDSMIRNIYPSLDWNTSTVLKEKSIPGLTSNLISDNFFSQYRKAGESKMNHKGNTYETVADITTSFTILLAIFFPSVTGIMAGSNRSGNLKDAQYSIPRGTIAAIATTSVVYLLSVIFFGATIQGGVLRDKFGESIGGSLIVSNMAWPNKWIILIGSLLSTIGAGLQSLTGAPRLLQAIANDNVIPFLHVFSVTSKDGEPKRALLLTLIISEIGVLIASLDAVAPIITMFFLMCYGFVNFACTLQSLLRLPNWRPRFRFYHWSLSLIGVCLCLALMFISSWYYALVAIAIALFFYKYIEYRGAEKEWGDGFNGLALSAARYGLLRLENNDLHTKNWRPQLLVLCESVDNVVPTLSEKNKKLISMVSQLKAGKGLTIIGCVYEGQYLESTLQVDELAESLNNEMKREKVKGFSKVIASTDIVDGYSALIQSAGLGGLKPNTIILCWPDNWKNDTKSLSFINAVRITAESKRALVVVKNPIAFPDSTVREDGTIDIWWIVHDGGLMLLMMFLLNQHKVWRKCPIRIFTVAEINDNSIQIKKDLDELMYNLRIRADIEVIEMENSDISAYTYERTLKAEERRQMVSKMRLSRRESRKEAQLIFDNQHRSKSVVSDIESMGINSNLIDENGSRKSSNTSTKELENHFNDVPLFNITKVPNKSNVQRMDTALRLNQLIHEKSTDSRLVMVNLPKPPNSRDKEFLYMEFIEALTEGIDRVLLVRGGGHEVVTIYS